VTFEEYLNQMLDVSVNEYRLVASQDELGVVSFYIHPIDVDGDTPTYTVADNSLTPVVVEVGDAVA
jgi:hypothetical protein